MPEPVASHWTRAHVAAIAGSPVQHAPAIVPRASDPGLAGLDLWDFWPVQELDGRVARFGADELWMVLSAPVRADPVERHALARIRLLRHAAGCWHDLGPLLPDGFGPGSREWSGSAIVDADRRRLTLYYTAAGRLGEPKPTYEQRLCYTSATMHGPSLSGWTAPRQIVRSDRTLYHPADQQAGAVGTIKAFRDPAFFRDPAGTGDWLLFAASLGRSASAFNGAVGLAHRTGDRWTLCPPLIEADHVNNELERPHMVRHRDLCYLLWSTQAQVFEPSLRAPTGLYGMVADRFAGPYRPLNGTGLVFANPVEQPAQAYSWFVSDTLEVTSFIDALLHDVHGPARRPLSIAPRLWLDLDGDHATLRP